MYRRRDAQSKCSRVGFTTPSYHCHYQTKFNSIHINNTKIKNSIYVTRHQIHCANSRLLNIRNSQLVQTSRFGPDNGLGLWWMSGHGLTANNRKQTTYNIRMHKISFRSPCKSATMVSRKSIRNFLGIFPTDPSRELRTTTFFLVTSNGNNRITFPELAIFHCLCRTRN